MRNLVAVKPLTYASRRLQVGDYFTTRSDTDARVLVAIGKAKRQNAVRMPGKLPRPPADLAKKIRVPDADKEALAKLRADYQEVIGKRPFNGWDAAELQKRIDEALAS